MIFPPECTVLFCANGTGNAFTTGRMADCPYCNVAVPLFIFLCFLLEDLVVVLTYEVAV